MQKQQIDLPRKLAPLFDPYRYKILYGGRGSAKSWTVARTLLLMAGRRQLRILCTREVQKSIKDSVKKLLEDQIKALKMNWFFDVMQGEIRGKNGSEILFTGLSDQTADSIKSFEGVDIVWLEEAQSISKGSMEILVPTIRKDGSEIWMTMNPELDTDPAYEYVTNPPEGAFVCEVNWRDNPWFPPVLELERQRSKDSAPAEEYEHIWEGRTRKSIAGAIYANEIETLLREGRARNVPYDPALAVHTVWDLGWNDSMVVMFVQRAASEVRIIDYIEDSHKTLDWYVAEINKRSYLYDEDFLPHDAEHKDFKTGKSTRELVEAMGRRVSITPSVSIQEGIRAARMMFPRVWIDRTKCARLIQCLQRYKRAINRQTGEPGAPLHDEFSHGADDFRYLALNVDAMRTTIAPPKSDWRKKVKARRVGSAQAA